MTQWIIRDFRDPTKYQPTFQGQYKSLWQMLTTSPIDCFFLYLGSFPALFSGKASEFLSPEDLGSESLRNTHNTANFTTKRFHSILYANSPGPRNFWKLPLLFSETCFILYSAFVTHPPPASLQRGNFSSILLKWPEFLSCSLRWKQGTHPIAPS